MELRKEMAYHIGFEAAIIKKLETIAELEEQYILAHVAELEQGAAKNKPFLRSRAILKQIKTFLRAAMELEKRHNMNSNYPQINTIADTVWDNDIFEESRKIIGNHGNIHKRKRELTSYIGKNERKRSEAIAIKARPVRTEIGNVLDILGLSGLRQTPEILETEEEKESEEQE